MEVIFINVLQIGSHSVPFVRHIHKYRRFQVVVNVIADEEIVIAVPDPSPMDVNCGMSVAICIGGDNAKNPTRRWTIAFDDFSRFKVPWQVQHNRIEHSAQDKQINCILSAQEEAPCTEQSWHF